MIKFMVSVRETIIAITTPITQDPQIKQLKAAHARSMANGGLMLHSSAT